MSATYASINATCPDTCVFRGRGCFAQNGFIKRITGPLDEEARAHHLWGIDVARNEAKLIDRAFGGGPVPQDGARGGRDLRLHVGGDAADERCAALLGAAALRWLERGGGAVWTYTHRWREIPRSSWTDAINVFASCETAADIGLARRRGYRPSMTLRPGALRGDQRQDVDGERVIPCPWETHRVTCNRCRLCLDSQPAGTIGFEVHGAVTRATRAVDSRRRIQLELIG